MSMPESVVVTIHPGRLEDRFVVEPAILRLSARGVAAVEFVNATETIVEVSLPNGFFDGDSIVLGPGDEAVLRVRLRPRAARLFEYSVFVPLANMAAEGGSAPKMILDP